MKNKIIAIAKKTIDLEARSISELGELLDDNFEKAITAINNCEGRLVVSGIGKSAIIAQKIVATLNSTGTPSIFLHAADAIHGDIGMVQQHDVVMILSKSGESPEIKILVPLIKNFKNILIALCGNMQSYLSRQADIVLNTTVTEEACPNNLAPTSSTTAQLVMGDALAICLMEIKGFSTEDFAKFHPGGTLGKKLYLRVAELIINNEKPVVKRDSPLKDVIIEITKMRLGATVIVDDEQKILGIITDGDLRRMLEKNISLQNLKADDIMTLHPKTIESSELAVDALDLMRKKNITQLIVVKNGKYAGIVHLHDLVREGII
ncbi:KpsF/GutQ family sugar-phosphate isomerase [Ginsengibacter hankyongi]|uniref:KpsF/GutQ family sugar-phosphate isomerase n=1 Tax=Ginsengibacter hankyongi TaxID=2607284 RepID=A0A5J5INT4_9BACT|nr:KpsF/GutQ family sugar-phosphate isomerase [Ginsengibacter hankyongi]KAA9041983.1 KpsF/GutQ family sugar-phosphate isomerase [Ginsengibacter hankyongi]